MNQEELYYKDILTKTNDSINIEANHLDIDCIHSNQNKFDLDNNGNLTVNRLTTIENFSLPLDQLYPIGSLFLSVNTTNPSTHLGGTWQQIAQGKTLIGVDPNDPDFNQEKKIGGSKNLQAHTDTITKEGTHSHGIYSGYNSNGGYGYDAFEFKQNLDGRNYYQHAAQYHFS